MWLSVTAIVWREIRNSSRPAASSRAISVTAGTWRSRRTASKCHSSNVIAFQGDGVTQAIWASMSSTKLLMLDAADSACPC